MVVEVVLATGHKAKLHGSFFSVLFQACGLEGKLEPRGEESSSEVGLFY